MEGEGGDPVSGTGYRGDERELPEVRERVWRRRVGLRVVAIVAVALLGWLASGPMTRQMLYPAPAYPVPSRAPAPWQELALDVLGKRTVAWSYEPSRATPRPPVLFFHGNGENLGTMSASGSLDLLAALGAPVLVLDYPGYGRSQGSPSEASLTEAGRIAGRELARRAGGPVVVVGWSLGAAVAVQVAVAEPRSVAGVVLLSAWDDLASLAAVHFPRWLVRVFLRERWDSLSVAPTLTVPVLAGHGVHDRIIPIQSGRRLYRAVPRLHHLFELEQTGHNDLLGHHRVWLEIEQFLDEVQQR